MNPTITSEVPGWLEKYGPMGCALIVVSIALIGLIWRVIPAIVHSAISGFNDRMDKHEETATERHGELKEMIVKLPELVHEHGKGAKARHA